MSAYHPIYNSMGTKNFSDGLDWGATTVTVHSIYDCIANAGTGNGRPETTPKEADKIYTEGENGITQLGYNYAKDEIELDVEANRLVSGLTGLNSGSVYSKFQSGTINYSYGVDANDKMTTLSSGYTVGDVLLIEALGTFYGAEVKEIVSTYDWRFKILNQDGQDILANGVSVNIYTKQKHPQLLTNGTKLSNKVYGNPNDYPSEWKAYLAGGGITAIIPALVSE